MVRITLNLHVDKQNQGGAISIVIRKRGRTDAATEARRCKKQYGPPIDTGQNKVSALTVVSKRPSTNAHQ